MSDTVILDGKEYISSKRASELSGYTQDYIGQLARKSHIEARRVSGLWYVLMDSLMSYKTAADAYKPEPPLRGQQSADPDSLISFDGKDYISAGRAAKLTGYHQDYVGQLARSGAIVSRQVGNRWYVEREGIVVHKREKDALLAAVQAESVGIIRSAGHVPSKVSQIPVEGPYFTYTSEVADLVPSLRETESMSASQPEEKGEVESRPVYIPIKRVHQIGSEEVKALRKEAGTRFVPIHGKTIFYKLVGGTVLTVVIVVVSGFFITAGRGISITRDTAAEDQSSSGFIASAGALADWIGVKLEQLVVPELRYRRTL